MWLPSKGPWLSSSTFTLQAHLFSMPTDKTHLPQPKGKALLQAQELGKTYSMKATVIAENSSRIPMFHVSEYLKKLETCVSRASEQPSSPNLSPRSGQSLLTYRKA